MNFLTSFEIRKKFFDFFKKNNHTLVKSSSLIPAQDPTLLFTNAGMNQFKDIFLSKEERSYKRAVSIQKCIRAGGKHNDLENVGFTKRHLTFFEMMGNFSFGDYFKKEAISYAWQFLTEILNLDPEKLYVSVYYQDQESYDIWQKDIKLKDNKIYKLSEVDNFWQMGETGPCGPCSEIYIDRGDKFGCENSICAPGCHCDRFLEIWNLVFMQFNKDLNGNLTELKSKGIDTGMGLERLCAIMQNKDSVYETDLFMPLIKKIEELSNINYDNSSEKIRASFRVLADHVRSSSFAISDGVIPSNEGRGYVLRKIIRRACLFSQKLGDYNIFIELVKVLTDYMSEIYPELKDNQDLIKHTLKSEIDKFSNNLIQGQNILDKYIKENKNNIISGYQAFKLYDTYGFPLELTKLIAQENNFKVDIEDFEKNMLEQKERSAKKDLIPDFIHDIKDITEFTGYYEHITKANIVNIIFNDNIVKEVKAGSDCYIITDRSPFYVECGGQISDKGYLKILDYNIEVKDLKKFNNAIAFKIETPLDLKVGESVILFVDSTLRINTMKNHTATHLLQAALIEIFGKKIKQAGSIVTPDYLRFDFTYDKNLSSQDIKSVENLVNKKIMENIDLNIKNLKLEEALKNGVIAFFEEKYNPESVRVIEIENFSRELCGGTHVKSTGDIGVFKIVQISALSSGVKRIVALTGPKALELFQSNFNIVKNLSQEFKVPEDKILISVEKQKEQLKILSSEIKDLKSKYYLGQINNFRKDIVKVNNINFLYLNLRDKIDNNELKDIALELNKIEPGFYFIVNNIDDNKAIFLGLLSDKINLDLKNLVQLLKSKNINSGSKNNIIQGGFENFKELNNILKEELIKFLDN